MGIFKNIFNKSNEPITTYDEFWEWFEGNEKKFFDVIKKGTDLEQGFFSHLSPKLSQLNEGIFFLTGMMDENKAELVLTPDGNIKNIVFVEELVNTAPRLSTWKFTALKPEMSIENVGINMAGYTFDADALQFYSNPYSEYPDEIDITIVHRDYKKEDKSTFINGTFIFLDNYLGELNSVTTIDNLDVIGPSEAKNELVPIKKLKDFLVWREKEFLEKYDGVRYDTENDEYASLEGKLSNGLPLVAVVNSTLLKWDRKASHPWVLNWEIKFKGNNNGMPDNNTYQLLDDIEHEVMRELPDFEGYLNIGRQTAEGIREVYFACKEFRTPSKIIHGIMKKYSVQFEMNYDIYKDKYWRSFDRFKPPVP